MNSKKAKQLRKLAKKLASTTGAPTENVYSNEDKHAVWGYLPYKKDSTVIDKDRLKSALDKIPNPKYKTENLGRRSVKFLRYVPGTPVTLDKCERYFYKNLKFAAVR